jgi:hypothetical protein
MAVRKMFRLALPSVTLSGTENPPFDGRYATLSSQQLIRVFLGARSAFDVRGYRKWAFGFTVIGMNSIAVYVATEVFDFRQVGNVFP